VEASAEQESGKAKGKGKMEDKSSSADEPSPHLEASFAEQQGGKACKGKGKKSMEGMTNAAIRRLRGRDEGWLERNPEAYFWHCHCGGWAERGEVGMGGGCGLVVVVAG
jgi:hypothetical protein